MAALVVVVSVGAAVAAVAVGDAATDNYLIACPKVAGSFYSHVHSDYYQPAVDSNYYS